MSRRSSKGAGKPTGTQVHSPLQDAKCAAREIQAKIIDLRLGVPLCCKPAAIAEIARLEPLLLAAVRRVAEQQEIADEQAHVVTERALWAQQSAYRMQVLARSEFRSEPRSEAELKRAYPDSSSGGIFNGLGGSRSVR